MDFGRGKRLQAARRGRSRGGGIKAQLEVSAVKTKRAHEAVVELDGTDGGVQVAANLTAETSIQTEGEEVAPNGGRGFAREADRQSVQVPIQ